jgi:hypothetical protein
MTETKPLGQLYYEEVEALKASGTSNADAVRQVAESHGKQVNAVRGGIHQYKRAHVDGATAASTTRRSRRSASATVDDYLASARQSLEDALALVDGEMERAKAALDAAQTRYDEAVTATKDRRVGIEKKLKALA